MKRPEEYAVDVALGRAKRRKMSRKLGVATRISAELGRIGLIEVRDVGGEPTLTAEEVIEFDDGGRATYRVWGAPGMKATLSASARLAEFLEERGYEGISFAWAEVSGRDTWMSVARLGKRILLFPADWIPLGAYTHHEISAKIETVNGLITSISGAVPVLYVKDTEEPGEGGISPAYFPGVLAPPGVGPLTAIRLGKPVTAAEVSGHEVFFAAHPSKTEKERLKLHFADMEDTLECQSLRPILEIDGFVVREAISLYGKGLRLLRGRELARSLFSIGTPIVAEFEGKEAQNAAAVVFGAAERQGVEAYEVRWGRAVAWAAVGERAAAMAAMIVDHAGDVNRAAAWLGPRPPRRAGLRIPAALGMEAAGEREYTVLVSGPITEVEVAGARHGAGLALRVTESGTYLDPVAVWRWPPASAVTVFRPGEERYFSVCGRKFIVNESPAVVVPLLGASGLTHAELDEGLASLLVARSSNGGYSAALWVDGYSTVKLLLGLDKWDLLDAIAEDLTEERYIAAISSLLHRLDEGRIISEGEDGSGEAAVV